MSNTPDLGWVDSSSSQPVLPEVSDIQNGSEFDLTRVNFRVGLKSMTDLTIRLASWRPDTVDTAEWYYWHEGRGHKHVTHIWDEFIAANAFIFEVI